MTGAGESPPSVGALKDGAIDDAPIARRAAARAVDFAIVLGAFLAIVLALSALAGPSPDGTGVVIIAIAVTFLIQLTYEVLLVGLRGRTLGKQLMGIEVVRADSEEPPGLRRAFLRHLIPTVLLVVFFPAYPVPYIAAALAKDHRWPHDRMAGTRVVVRAR